MDGETENIGGRVDEDAELEEKLAEQLFSQLQMFPQIKMPASTEEHKPLAKPRRNRISKRPEVRYTVTAPPPVMRKEEMFPFGHNHPVALQQQRRNASKPATAPKTPLPLGLYGGQRSVPPGKRLGLQQTQGGSSEDLDRLLYTIRNRHRSESTFMF